LYFLKSLLDSNLIFAIFSPCLDGTLPAKHVFEFNNWQTCQKIKQVKSDSDFYD